MRGFRAKLKAVRRKKKDGTTYWAARGFVPERQPDGTFARRRVEHGIGGLTAAARQTEVDKLNSGYEERALHVPLTFSRAYLNYIEHNDVPIYFKKILDGVGDTPGLGERQCREIDDTIMITLSQAMFAEDASPAYINRHLYTPVLAILRMALKEHAPQLTRPKGYKDSPPVQIPDKAWFQAVLPFMSADTKALVSMLTMHGRRLGDALGRKPADFSDEDGTLTIGRTKNGDPMLIDLHPHVAALIRAMPDWKSRRWLFRDGPEADSNVRRDILKACVLASGYDEETATAVMLKPTAHKDLIAELKVPYFSPHELGRHSFATRMLRAGYSLQYVKDAGGWKSIEVLSKLYGHLERKEWTAEVHKVGDTFVNDISSISGGEVGDAPPAAMLVSPNVIDQTACQN
jgi:integrase